MKNMNVTIAVCLLSVCMADASSGQAPLPATPAPSPAQDTAPQKPQSLSKQVASDCYNRRRLAIRSVNLKYIDLTKAAAELFTKENNQPRTDDANTWIKNLDWANDANFKGIATDVKDRLGELQAAYLKERVNAIVIADNASIEDVEAAIKKAAQTGEQADMAELAKQEDRIKQDLRFVTGPNAPGNTVASASGPAAANPAPKGTPGVAAAPAATSKLSLAAKTNADYNTTLNNAIRNVNQKYVKLALSAMELFVKEDNQPRAAEANDWARRLGWTDNGNLQGLDPDANDRLGNLQALYIKERSTAVTTVEKASMEGVKSAQKEVVKEGDQEGAKTLEYLITSINKDLAGGNSQLPAKPAGPPTPGEQLTADFNHARADAVKIVNQKYAGDAKAAADLFLKDGNQARAGEANDWARRLGWTDDVGNLRGLAPDAGDNLGALQASYLKDRASALKVVDNAWIDKLKEAQQKSTRETDPKGAVALMQTMNIIDKELGITSPRPVASAPVPSQQGSTENNQPAMPQPSGQPDSTHPFGVTEDKLKPVTPP